MRLRVVSDCHLDMFPDSASRVHKICSDAASIDVLVIAGDLCEIEQPPGGFDPMQLGLYGRTIQEFASKFKTIIAVMGNHEYYHTSFGYVEQYVRELQKLVPNYHCLDLCGPLEIEGRVFVGGTLWFVEREDPMGYGMRLNDFRSIEDFRLNAYPRGLAVRAKIAETVTNSTVVVTHHAPSMRSAKQELLSDPMTERFYVHDCTQIICEQEPALWIHGHMHTPVDYIHPASTTRVLSNPLGYPRQTGGAPNRTVEI